jgi:hypothetical protein
LKGAPRECGLVIVYDKGNIRRQDDLKGASPLPSDIG